MNFFLSLIIFIFGLLVGSFLNCVIFRIEKNESFLLGRSYCPNCKHKLSFLDLIPIFSFLFLKGKCRYCQKKISWQYPLIELVAGLLFLLVFHFYSLSLLFFFFSAVISLLLIVFVYDLKHYLIPDNIIYFGIILVSLYLICSKSGFDHLWAALGLAGSFLAIVYFSKEKWMGLGDVKLAFLMGLILGWPATLVALFLASFTGAIMGIGLILLRKKGMKSEVPFGPFLTAGTVISLFWANELMTWYFNLFNYVG